MYVPTNHLYLGDIVICERERATFPDISVEDGIRIFLTGGMALPPRVRVQSRRRLREVPSMIVDLCLRGDMSVSRCRPLAVPVLLVTACWRVRGSRAAAAQRRRSRRRSRPRRRRTRRRRGEPGAARSVDGRLPAASTAARC